MAPRRLAVTPAKDARLQLKEVGAANDILRLRNAARQRELMPQLRRIAGDAVIARDQRKPAQPRVQELRRCWRSHLALAHCGGLSNLYRYFRPSRNEYLSYTNLETLPAAWLSIDVVTLFSVRTSWAASVIVGSPPTERRCHWSARRGGVNGLLGKARTRIEGARAWTRRKG